MQHLQMQYFRISIHYMQRPMGSAYPVWFHHKQRVFLTTYHDSIHTLFFLQQTYRQSRKGTNPDDQKQARIHAPAQEMVKFQIHFPTFCLQFRKNDNQLIIFFSSNTQPLYSDDFFDILVLYQFLKEKSSKEMYKDDIRFIGRRIRRN